MLTTDITSVGARVPASISSRTQVSAKETHTASDRVAPPSTSAVRIEPLWSTTTTVCEVHAWSSCSRATAFRCSTRIRGVMAFSGTSNPNPGSGHDVISRVLLASVT